MIQEILVFFTSTRGVDVFWSPLSVAILGGLVLAIILRSGSKSEKSDSDRKGLSLTEVRDLIKSELGSRPRPPRPASSRNDKSTQNNNDEGVIWLLVIGLLFLAVGYARYQNHVLDYSVIAATSLFGFWVATVIFSLLKGTISGSGWTIYTVVVALLSLLALPILYLSLNPIHSPDGISNLQQVATDEGLMGLIRNYGAEGLIFLTFQVMGFIVLYGSWLYILFTLIYMASSSLVVTGVKGRPFWFWLTIRTSKFAKPIKSTIIVVILYVLSFILISGLVYEWWRPASNL